MEDELIPAIEALLHEIDIRRGLRISANGMLDAGHPICAQADKLEQRPRRMARLATDHRGFVVPWFVQWFEDGKPAEYGQGAPDFRVADERKFVRALKQKLCWLCGDKLGAHLAFVIGPMCAVNQVTSEPPCHLECAEYACRVCPFLSRPRMRRNEHELPEERVAPAGFGLKRNPGAACIWVTRSYTTFRPHRGANGVLVRLGEAERVLWYCEGRPASRAEADASIASGYPELRKVAELGGEEELAELRRGLAAVSRWLPAEARA